MASTIFVSGATGQTGGNVCEQLIERGDRVRALVATRTTPRRWPRSASNWSRAISVTRTMCFARPRARMRRSIARHCWVVPARTWKPSRPSTWSAPERPGRGQSPRHAPGGGAGTGTFLDLSTDLDFEEAPVLENPPDDPYTVTKLAAFLDATGALPRVRTADLPSRGDLRSFPGRRTRLTAPASTGCCWRACAERSSVTWLSR